MTVYDNNGQPMTTGEQFARAITGHEDQDGQANAGPRRPMPVPEAGNRGTPRIKTNAVLFEETIQDLFH